MSDGATAPCEHRRISREHRRVDHLRRVISTVEGRTEAPASADPASIRAGSEASPARDRRRPDETAWPPDLRGSFEPRGMPAVTERKLATERDGDPRQGLEADALSEPVLHHRPRRLADPRAIAEPRLRLELRVARHSNVVPEVNEHLRDRFGLVRQSIWHGPIRSQSALPTVGLDVSVASSRGRDHHTEMAERVVPTRRRSIRARAAHDDSHCYHRRLLEGEIPLA